jgi:hypothetical protein
LGTRNYWGWGQIYWGWGQGLLGLGTRNYWGWGQGLLGFGTRTIGVRDKNYWGWGQDYWGWGQELLGLGTRTIGVGDKDYWGSGQGLLGLGTRTIGVGDKTIGVGDKTIGVRDKTIGIGDNGNHLIKRRLAREPLARNLHFVVFVVVFVVYNNRLVVVESAAKLGLPLTCRFFAIRFSERARWPRSRGETNQRGERYYGQEIAQEEARTQGPSDFTG